MTNRVNIKTLNRLKSSWGEFNQAIPDFLFYVTELMYSYNVSTFCKLYAIICPQNDNYEKGRKHK